MKIKKISNISEIDAEIWNNLIEDDYPFIRHEFLLALEESGSVSIKTGWQPQHLLVYSNNELIACMPMYLKFHSRGEYVFDNQWAQAYMQQGMEYYPKWLSAIPFTPCQGKRFYSRSNSESATILKFIFEYIKENVDQYDISSWHCLFPDAEQAELLHSIGLSLRENVQFHWINRNYRDFIDFLDTFNSRNRKKIKRERRRIKEQGIQLLRIAGQEISDSQLQIFYEFYQITYLKKGMHPYLNKTFFIKIVESMPERLLLVIATQNKNSVGAALSFISNDTLYGRYWGCYDEFHSLHFETCYYQGLEFCIENGLKIFNSGAQGEHKIARGFEPVITYSAHWFKNPTFAQAIDNFLDRETSAIEQYKNETTNFLPYKNRILT
jgi:predicted N-acyltransferase